MLTPQSEAMFLVSRALIATLEQKDSITFESKQSRKVNYATIERFLQYLRSEGIDTKDLEIALREPHRYLDVVGAEALDIPAGTKTARAVQKYLARKGFVSNNKMFCYFADAVSPIENVSTYEAKLGESPFDDYDRVVFTINGNDYCSVDLRRERVVDTFHW